MRVRHRGGGGVCVCARVCVGGGGSSLYPGTKFSHNSLEDGRDRIASVRTWQSSFQRIMDGSFSYPWPIKGTLLLSRLDCFFISLFCYKKGGFSCNPLAQRERKSGAMVEPRGRKGRSDSRGLWRSWIWLRVSWTTRGDPEIQNSRWMFDSARTPEISLWD